MIHKNQLKRPYKNGIRTDFHNDRIPPVKSQCTAYSIIFTDPIYKSDKGY